MSVAVGLVIGLLVERLLVRPLRRRTSSPVSLLLLTIGISEILLGLTYIPRLGPNTNSAPAYPQPYVSHWRIGHVVLSGVSVLTMVLVPLLLVALTVFLSPTKCASGKLAGAKQAFNVAAYPNATLDNFRLDHLNIEAATAGAIANAKNWTMTDNTIKTTDGSKVTFTDSTGKANPKDVPYGEPK